MCNAAHNYSMWTYLLFIPSEGESVIEYWYEQAKKSYKWGGVWHVFVEKGLALVPQ
jgi:hypothetical protein